MKEYGVSFVLAASTNGSFTKSFKSAQNEIRDLQDKIGDLQKIQGNITSYKKQAQAFSEVKEHADKLQREYDELYAEMQNIETPSAAMVARLNALQKSKDDAALKAQSYENKLESLGAALKDAEVDTNDLKTASDKLGTEIGELRREQEEAARSSQNFGQKASKAVEDLNSVVASVGLIEGVRKITDAFIDCSKASIEFESAAAGVYKTVDGTRSELSKITEDIKEMSTEIPATTTEIASVAEAAGQLGIAKGDIIDFTRVMIDLGESTNLTADEAATSLAKFANITRTPSENYSRLGSVIVDLGNNLATTEADIVAMSTRLASSGKLAGFTEYEIMALSAAMSSVGIEAEAGGTAMTQTFSAIEKAVAEGGEGLLKFAKVSDMSSEEFANAWENNAIGALEAFFKGVGTLESKGESAVLVLDELGLTGIRQGNMIKSLGLAADTLGQSIGIASNAWEENNALTIEANKRYATTESQLGMLGNKFNNLKIAIGDVYAPTVRGAVSDLGDMVEGITEFVEENPKTVKALGVTATGLGVVVGGLAAAKVAMVAFNAVANMNPIVGWGTVIAGVTVGLNTFIATANDVSEQLTASSKAQKAELEALQKEYAAFSDEEKKTNQEALNLRYEIEKLSDEFEANKRTIGELWAEHEALNKELDNNHEAFRNTLYSIDEEETKALSLINKLDELTGSGANVVSSQGEIKAIIEALNSSVDGLNLTYDDLIKNQKTAISGAKESVTSFFKKQEYKTAETRYSQALLDVESANKAKEEAKKIYDDLSSAFWDRNGGLIENVPLLYDLMPEFMTGESEVTEAYDKYLEECENLENAENDLATATQILTDFYIEEADATAEAEEAQKAYADSLEDVQEFATSVCESLEEIITKYDDAYIAAKQSMEGQYSLFEKAASVSATNTSTLTANLESQTEYWKSYKSNLEILVAKGSEIEGLTDIIGKFSDGTQDSVNIVAGLVKATDDEIAAFVEAFNINKEEISTIADISGQLQSDLGKALDDLRVVAETGIEELNLSEDMAAVAEEAFGAYIDEIEVQTSRAAIAVSNFQSTIGNALNIPIGDVTSEGSDALFVSGYASGTDYASPGLHWVGEHGPELMMFAGGERVMTADESVAFSEDIRAVALLSPHFYSLEKTLESTALLSKQSSGISYSPQISVTFQIDGNASSDTVSSLETYGDDFANRVLEVIEEANADTLRRSYT